MRALVAQIEAGILRQDEWTHEAHVAYATWAVLACGRDAALARIRSAILRLNAATASRTCRRAAITSRSRGSTWRGSARCWWIEPDLLPLSAAAAVE